MNERSAALERYRESLAQHPAVRLPAVIAERDRYRKALEEIIDRGVNDAATHIAREALKDED